MPLGSPSRRGLAASSVRVVVDCLCNADKTRQKDIMVGIPMKAIVLSSSEDAIFVVGCCPRCNGQREWCGPFVGSDIWAQLQGSSSRTNDGVRLQMTQAEHVGWISVKSIS